MTGEARRRAELGDGDPRRYIQVAGHIRGQIRDGVLAPGAAVPSVAKLADEHECSRQTCTKALRVLLEKN